MYRLLRYFKQSTHGILGYIPRPARCTHILGTPQCYCKHSGGHASSTEAYCGSVVLRTSGQSFLFTYDTNHSNVCSRSIAHFYILFLGIISLWLMGHAPKPLSQETTGPTSNERLWTVQVESVSWLLSSVPRSSGV